MLLFPAMLGPTKTLIGPSCKSSSRRLLKFFTCSRVIIFPYDILLCLAVEGPKRLGRDCPLFSAILGSVSSSSAARPNETSRRPAGRTRHLNLQQISRRGQTVPEFPEPTLVCLQFICN